VLAAVMPGCEKLDKTGDNTYEGTLKIKVGPVQGLFNGKVELDNIDAPNGYTMKVDGRGTPGFVQATSSVALAAKDDKTEMTYEADARVGGRIASVGQRLIESSAKAIIKQSLEGPNTMGGARAAAERGRANESGGVGDGDGDAGAKGSAETEGNSAEPAPLPEIAKPTQADFAKAVAKEVAAGLIPPKYRLPVIGGVLAIIVGVIWFFLS
jgi:carbon monoxide dehydrogenase subunit G